MVVGQAALIGAGALGAAAWILYAVTAPTTVGLEDDGLFLAAAWHYGVAHPPGYPLYTALAWLATHVPVGSIPWRGHVLSGGLAALTCALVAWIVTRRTGSLAAGIAGGGLLAVSEHLWSQAIVTDVYTLHTAVVAGIVALLTMAERSETRIRWWLPAAGLYGLGMAGHYPLLVLASPAFAAYAITDPEMVRKRLPMLALAAMAGPLILYGAMVWRSWGPVEISFFGPIDDWKTAWLFLARRVYTHVDYDENAGLLDKAWFALHQAKDLGLQLGPWGAALGLWGAVTAWRQGWRARMLCEAGALAASSFGLIVLLGFVFEPQKVYTFRPYSLAAYLFLALWAGEGIAELSRRLPAPWRKALWTSAGAAILATGIWNAKSQTEGTNGFGEWQARKVLELVPDGALLVLYTDGFVGPIGYLQTVERARPQVRTTEYHGLVIGDRLIPPITTKDDKERDWSRVLQELKGEGQPVYSLWFGPSFINGGAVHEGFMIRSGEDTIPGQLTAAVNREAEAWYRQLSEMNAPIHPAARVQRNELLRIYGEYLAITALTGDAEGEKVLDRLLPFAERSYWTQIGMARVLALEAVEERPEILERTRRAHALAVELAGDDRSPVHRSWEAWIGGRIAWADGDETRAEAAFRAAMRLNRASESHARRQLEHLLWQRYRGGG